MHVVVAFFLILIKSINFFYSFTIRDIGVGTKSPFRDRGTNKSRIVFHVRRCACLPMTWLFVLVQRTKNTTVHKNTIVHKNTNSNSSWLLLHNTHICFKSFFFVPIETQSVQQLDFCFWFKVVEHGVVHAFSLCFTPSIQRFVLVFGHVRVLMCGEILFQFQIIFVPHMVCDCVQILVCASTHLLVINTVYSFFI